MSTTSSISRSPKIRSASPITSSPRRGPTGRWRHPPSAAGDATDRIIYDAATGNIFYDPDGTGAAAATLFATVDPGTALTHADFLIYG